jgi:uncharacterized membrane protein YebE (DUF533 family)
MKKIVIIGLFALGTLGGLTYCNWSDNKKIVDTENTDGDKDKEGDKNQVAPIDTTQKGKDSSEVKPSEQKDEKNKPETKPEEKEKEEKK